MKKRRSRRRRKKVKRATLKWWLTILVYFKIKENFLLTDDYDYADDGNSINLDFWDCLEEQRNNNNNNEN